MTVAKPVLTPRGGRQFEYLSVTYKLAGGRPSRTLSDLSVDGTRALPADAHPLQWPTTEAELLAQLGEAGWQLVGYALDASRGEHYAKFLREVTQGQAGI
ncbi:MAG: hypothetical protein BRC58_08690 [Cyanobacteria bacterium QS_8_64_29]|nr:MAG: hypothetical protein BRC58_08690 [Cyanobacteria bacterium QS_8_64_29]